MKNNIYIATAADDNYARGLLVMLASFLKTHEACIDSVFNIIILDGGLSHDTKSRIIALPKHLKINNQIQFKFIAPDLSHLTHVPKLWGKSNLTLARLQIAELIPKADYVYWIDSDFIINKPLPNLDCLGEKMIAACIEAHLPTLEEDFPELEYPFGSRANGSKPYINAGFMVIDLNKWRQHKIGEKGTDAMCKYPKNFKWMDQSVINFFAADSITIIDANYNYNLHSMDSNIYLEKHWKECNLHLTGALKPWAIDTYQDRVFYQHLVFLLIEESFFSRNNKLQLNYLEGTPKVHITKILLEYIKLWFSFVFNRKNYLKKVEYKRSKKQSNAFFRNLIRSLNA